MYKRQSLQNTSAGHGYVMGGQGSMSGATIIGNIITVTNSSAFCITSVISTAKLNNNSFIGTTTPLNSLTLEAVTIDAAGNISTI